MDTVTLTRTSAGHYTYSIRGVTFEVYQQKERDCSWFGEWIVVGNGTYSDPIRTLGDCRAALADMEARADLFRIGVPENHPYPIERHEPEYEYYRLEHKQTGEAFYERSSIYSMGPFNPNYKISKVTRAEYENAAQASS